MHKQLSMRRPGLALAAIVCATLPSLVSAQSAIRTDSTLGKPAVSIAGVPGAGSIRGNNGQAFPVTGSLYTIPQELGKSAGANLFHSFERFSVGPGDAALFTSNIAGLQHVISRVTGGEVSKIFGLLSLQAAGAHPDFYFLNPAGVLVGAGAQIDVPAGFHVSTAGRLKFADGFAWDLTTPAGSNLTIAPPQAFGFLSDHAPATVRMSNVDAAGVRRPHPKIVLAPGGAFDIVAGAIELDAVDVTLADGMLRLAAVGNSVTDVSIRSASSVPLNGSILTDHAFLIMQGAAPILLEGGAMTLREGLLNSDNPGPHPAAPIRLISSGDVLMDGISVISQSDSTAATGLTAPIFVDVKGDLLLKNGGYFITRSFGAADSAPIFVSAHSLLIDGDGAFSQIVTQSDAGGNAGDITIRVSKAITMLNLGEISTNTLGSGSTGAIDIQAESLTLDGLDWVFLSTGILSKTWNFFEHGNAGPIKIKLAKGLEVKNAMHINSITSGSGNAGAIDIEAGSVKVDGTDDESGIFSQAQGFAGNGGAIKLLVHGPVEIVGFNSGISTNAENGAAGAIDISADSLSMSGFVAGVFGQASGDGDGGLISIKVGKLSIAHGAGISSDAGGSGAAGTIDIHARSLSIDGDGLFGGISSQSTSGTARGGAIRIVVEEDLSVINGGQISSSTHSAGAAGEVDIHAHSLTVSGSGPLSSSTILSETNAAGNSGAVKVKVTGTLTIADGGAISSSTFDAGSAGGIDITTRSLIIDGHDTGVLSEASADSSGQAGKVSVAATDGITLRNEGRLSIRSHAVVAHPETLEPAALSVATPRIEMSQGGQITAETTGNVAAGSIEIRAEAAGVLSITARDDAQITSSTRLPRADELAVGQLGPGPGAGSGNAGNVSIQAGNLTISGVSVLSEAQPGTTGSAGTVKLSAAGNLSVLDNTRIATDTSGAGRAGDVSITAGNLMIDPSEISSRAAAGSSGQTGNVQVTATGSVTIADQSRLSIQNDAHVGQPTALTPSTIIVTAPRIDLLGGQISAASSDNAAASNVQLNTTQLVMRNAAIGTNAKDGNGGSIRIQSGGFVMLDHAQITTSVSGLQNGNGGDITVSTPVLAMDVGFIQANTQAALARGGNVVIDAGAIVANGAVLIGGDTPLRFNAGLTGLNVIQAAAPGGVSGSVAVSVPVLDIAGSLRGLSAETVDSGALARDLCRLGATSSFTPLGRGGLRPIASGLIRPELGNSTTSASHDREENARVAAFADSDRLQTYRCR